jgi:hypothetical protein
MIWLLISVSVSFAIGLMAVLLLWPHQNTSSPVETCLKTFIAAGLGQGMTSCLTFLYLLLNGRADESYWRVEFLVACVLAIVFLTLRKTRPPGTSNVRSEQYWKPPYQWLLAIAFCATAAAALATVALELSRAPHGGWDAWAIWNSRARAIFRGSYEWRDSFAVVPTLHADYPLLLPLSVVRGWMYMGKESTAVPMLLAWLFTAGIIGVLTAAIGKLRGTAFGYVAGIALLGSSFFVTHASTQYADVPLTFFYVAAFALVALDLDVAAAKGSGWIVLAGVSAALAAWTKNEGLMFLVAFGAAYLATFFLPRPERPNLVAVVRLGAGLLPLLLMIMYFKTQFAPPNDLISSMTVPSTLEQLTDPGRYFYIAKEFARRFLVYNGIGINLTYALLMFLVCFGLTWKRTSAKYGTLLFLLMLSGFIFVYMTTNSSIEALMKYSVDRVLLQLWPMFLFTFFLLVTSQQRVTECSAQPRRE